MRIINTTQIVDPNIEQPLLGASLDFLTQNQLETLQAVCRAFIGPSYSSTQVYVLWGCVFSNPSAYAMTAGAIFYNGEIYQVNSASALGNDLTKIFPFIHNDPTTTDPYTGSRALDPVTFSDGVTTGNVHITNYYTVASALGGTSPASGWIYMNKPIYTAITSFDHGWVANTGLFWWIDAQGQMHIFGDINGTSASGGEAFVIPNSFVPKGDWFGIISDLSGNALPANIAPSVGIWYFTVGGTYTTKIHLGHIILPPA